MHVLFLFFPGFKEMASQKRGLLESYFVDMSLVLERIH